MSQTPVTALEKQAERVFALIDAMDPFEMADAMEEDAQALDEIAGGWIRGRELIQAYFEQLRAAASDLHSRVRDIQALEWGDTAIVTCTVDQTFLIDGREHRRTAPASITLRRRGDDWRVVLFHSARLP